jgi:hypothetical protein
MLSPYVHVIKVLRGPRVAASPGTGAKYRMELKDRSEPPILPEFSTSTQKEEKGGDIKDSLNKTDNTTLAR